MAYFETTRGIRIIECIVINGTHIFCSGSILTEV